MTAIPANTVTIEELVQWQKMQTELAALRASEMLLRRRIFAHYFPAAVEGTNTAPLSAGWVLKGVLPIDREIDKAALESIRPKFEAAKISEDALVRYKPDLVVRAYRTLTEEQRQLFDQALVVKPGSPSLSIELPKKASQAAEAAAGTGAA